MLFMTTWALTALQTRFTTEKNDRFLAQSTSEVTGVFQTKHPASVMVLGIVGSDGKKMPPYFFKQGEKIGADVYYRVLSYTVLP